MQTSKLNQELDLKSQKGKSLSKEQLKFLRALMSEPDLTYNQLKVLAPITLLEFLELKKLHHCISLNHDLKVKGVYRPKITQAGRMAVAYDNASNGV